MSFEAGKRIWLAARFDDSVAGTVIEVLDTALVVRWDDCINESIVPKTVVWHNDPEK